MIVHPNINETRIEHNIALLELETSLTNSIAKPAVLASSHMEISENTLVTIIGWGRINASAFFYPTRLQGVEIPVVDREVCRKQYQEKYNVTKNMFCAELAGGRSPCYGDDGGSASVDKIVVGITNGWGVSCALSSTSAIFMRLAEYRDWINSVADV